MAWRQSQGDITYGICVNSLAVVRLRKVNHTSIAVVTTEFGLGVTSEILLVLTLNFVG